MLYSNRRIGAAVGTLMARHGSTHDQAFPRLRQARQHANRNSETSPDDIFEVRGLPATRRRTPRADDHGQAIGVTQITSCAA